MISTVEFPYPIIDAHHHLWDLEAVHYPWLATKGIVRFFGDPAPIQKNYLVEDLKQDIGELPVQGSVHIQVGADDNQHLLESQTVQSFADASSLANGIVAYCELEDPLRNLMLDELAKLDNFRGVRQIIGRSPTEDKQTGTSSLLNNSDWLNGLQELERRSLTFDLQLIPDQMQQTAKLLANTPDLRVALCHCGSPWFLAKEGVDKNDWRIWKDGLSALAAHDNTFCKISGLSMFDHNWTVETLTPIINTVIDVFGPERCMFGSNFPVDKLHTDYKRIWYAYLEIVEQYPSTLSLANKQNLFKNNCANFYSIL